MMTGAKIENVSDGKFKNYRHCLAAIQCNPAQTEIFFGQFEYCPGLELLYEILECFFDEQMVDQIQFKQWTTDQVNIEDKDSDC